MVIENGDKVRVVDLTGLGKGIVEQLAGNVFTAHGVWGDRYGRYCSLAELRGKFPNHNLNVDRMQVVNDEDQKSTEATPEGCSLNVAGAKADAGKPRMDLVLGGFSEALLRVAEVGTFGANKYTDNGWKEVANGRERYTDALLRHLFASKKEAFDRDSHLLHLAHAAWNALAVLELYLKEEE